jgi:outer membrane protein, heavy metal efflux system
MRIHLREVLAAAAAILIVGCPILVIAAESGLTAAQLVEIAIEVNPQIHAARDHWYSAMHSIKQSYTPADPILGYANLDSATNGFSAASVHTLTVTEPFQFPGKAILQGDNARRNADIAKLMYEAQIRDIRAQTETAYYQVLLDHSLIEVQSVLINHLNGVLNAAQTAYSANKVTQTDFVSANFDLAVAQQQQKQLKVTEANDETTLDQLLYRSPDSPLNLDFRLVLEPLEIPLDKLIERAAQVRQEILETALTERSSATALELAKFEYVPDFVLGYTFDNYLLSSAAPAASGRMQDHGFSISMNAPLFFWIKQREDVKRAIFDLETARDNLGSIRSQTAANVTNLYRTAQLAYQTAILYRDTLIPLAQVDFEVALGAYESGKIDFMAIVGVRRRIYDSRVAYLQAANQYLATRVALEQAVGEPLK